MIETELPETQLQPELMQELFDVYMDSLYSSVVDERLLQELRSVMENDLQQTERDWGEEFY